MVTTKMLPLFSGVEISEMQMHSAMAESETANPRMKRPTSKRPKLLVDAINQNANKQ